MSPPGLPVYGVEYFLGFKKFTGGFKQHNASLKWHRDTNEIPDRPFESPVVQFPNDRPAKMPTIFHDAYVTGPTTKSIAVTRRPEY